MTLSRGMRLVVATVTAGLVAAGTGFVASGTADASSYCNDVQPGQTVTLTGEFYVSVAYQGGTHRICGYDTQIEWMNGVRDIVVHGAQGASGATQAEAIDRLPNSFVQVGAHFTGAGANGSTATSNDSQGNGPRGWLSATKVPCHDAFVPSTAADNEAAQLQDYFYHLGQVVKSNSSGYTGTPVAATELISPSGQTAYYAPHCTDLR